MTTTLRYIAFSTVTQRSLAAADTAAGARDETVRFHHLPTAKYIEVLDCGTDGRAVWLDDLPLWKARQIHPTVFRGAGYEPHLPAIEMQEVTP